MPGRPVGGPAAPGPSAPPPAPRPVPRNATEAWAAIVADVIRVRPTLGHLLSEGVVVDEAEGRLTVAVPNGSAFVNDQLKKPENRELVLETARRVQPGLRDVAFAAGVPAASVPGGTHPVVQAAMELFEGDITQVRPAPGARSIAAAEPAGGGGEAP